ncbi:nitroreductase/quinone reductase family protein [Actinocorallia sp. A-T 12471]|uniref:nitroreductase/quinone reductase family protein n=1 Tax=Actinocorallia sp. A-T 12471 TaxID=3089813 RepID=UPI0029CD7322|nr:nitroreductase/quinone reductase family protein [Actinocorallia sp. A-T 12471]MDX6744698.1 nitroreductase/quinone reductase family protein [Actinocorallia sp. A-T 12471]
MAGWNDKIIEEFRANKGVVGGMFEGAALLLLTSSGHKTGRPHTTPLGYLAEDGRLLVFASNAGGPTDPVWYRNVRADPRVTVEVGEEKYPATALALHGAERDAAYARQGELVPAYAEYQRGTDRVIPVVALYPADYRADRAAAVGDHLREVHKTLRTTLADLARPDADGSDAYDLYVHCLTACGALGEHHAAEDGVFPRLEAIFPGLSKVVGVLRREHAEVAAMNEGLRALAERGASREEIAAESARISSALEAHFAYEEEQLVPLLNALRREELTDAEIG